MSELSHDVVHTSPLDVASGEHELNLRFAGVCTVCGGEIAKGVRAIYSPTTKSVHHILCPEFDRGIAGESAYREYDRRLARDDRRIAVQKEKVEAVFGDGILGKIAILMAVDDSPRRSTSVWKQGAIGEEKVGARLDALTEVGVTSLHDRRIPGTRANIDHLVVTPWGVWVVDAKRYLDKRPELVVSGGLFSPRREQLKVGGRVSDKLVDGALWQMDRVRAVVGDRAQVSGALCFVEADWPLIGGAFRVRNVEVCWPRRLAKILLIAEQPTLDVDSIARQLAVAFPPA